jgi:hypothetical protein
MDPDHDILRRFFDSVHLRHDDYFGSVLTAETFTIPFLPRHRIESEALRSAVLALASFMQVDVSNTGTETLDRETTLCIETWAALRDKDFVKVFYSCFVRFIIFSMSGRSQTDIDYECVGLWASFCEIGKQRSVLGPGELITMENCLYFAIPALVPSDRMSFSSQQSQMPPYVQTLLGLWSEQEELWVPVLPANEIRFGFGNLNSWYNQIEEAMTNFRASLFKKED